MVPRIVGMRRSCHRYFELLTCVEVVAKESCDVTLLRNDCINRAAIVLTYPTVYS